ncbi:MAG: V-type ATPase subunit, partial [Bacteroidales bacterium]
MKQFFAFFPYLKPYWRQGLLNILFNLLSVVFSIFSLLMLAPFLGILFGTQPMVDRPAHFNIFEFKENLNFATAVGKIRALSARLFTASDWERLLTAKTTRDLSRLLVETQYGRIIGDTDSFDDIQCKLVSYLLLEMDEIEKIVPEREFLYYFR